VGARHNDRLFSWAARQAVWLAAVGPEKVRLIMRALIATVLALAGAVAPATGCGHTHGTPTRTAAPARAPSRNPTFLTLDEISSSGAATAFEVVETLRPLWFNKRGPQSFVNDGDVWVYDGNARLGTRDALREIAATTVASMTYLDAKEANYRYGRGHPYGAIVVSFVFPVGH
jgi:hypothetical protein